MSKAVSVFGDFTSRVLSPFGSMRTPESVYVCIGFYGFEDGYKAVPVFDRETVPGGKVGQLVIAGREFDYYGKFKRSRFQSRPVNNGHASVPIDIENPSSYVGNIIRTSGLAVMSSGEVFVSPDMRSPEKFNIMPLAQYLYEGAKSRMEKTIKRN